MPERLPPWLHIRTKSLCGSTATTVQRHGISTICEEASCPNRAVCYQHLRATFLLLGPLCTRRCGFCGVRYSEHPPPPRASEIEGIIASCQEMGTREIVLTMVTRDDLIDGGSEHCARAIRLLREAIPGSYIEVLTSDFLGSPSSIHRVLDAGPDCFAHNIETVASLSPTLRSGASYERSLQTLETAKRYSERPNVKSGMMLGLGERPEEVHQALRDLRSVGTDIITLGQYLRPSQRAVSVVEYVTPEQFDVYRHYAHSLGFLKVVAGPLVRSSIHEACVSNASSEKEKSCRE